MAAHVLTAKNSFEKKKSKVLTNFIMFISGEFADFSPPSGYTMNKY